MTCCFSCGFACCLACYSALRVPSREWEVGRNAQGDSDVVSRRQPGLSVVSLLGGSRLRSWAGGRSGRHDRWADVGDADVEL